MPWFHLDPHNFAAPSHGMAFVLTIGPGRGPLLAHPVSHLTSPSGIKRTCRFALQMSAFDGGFNRSTQHLLILPDGEVSDGVACTDMVHAEAEGRALGALEERSMRSGYCARS